MDWQQEKIDALQERINRVEMPWLRARIRDWQNCHGWLMRPYYRDLAKQALRDVRMTQWAIEKWRAA